MLLSGCAPALVGVGTAAVAASSTEKGLTTSVSDSVICQIQDRFIQADASLSTVLDVTVNDAAVLLTGKVKTPEEKVLATRLVWEVRGVRGGNQRGSGYRHILDQGCREGPCGQRAASWQAHCRYQCLVAEFQPMW